VTPPGTTLRNLRVADECTWAATEGFCDLNPARENLTIVSWHGQPDTLDNSHRQWSARFDL